MAQELLDLLETCTVIQGLRGTGGPHGMRGIVGWKVCHLAPVLENVINLLGREVAIGLVSSLVLFN